MGHVFYLLLYVLGLAKYIECMYVLFLGNLVYVNCVKKSLFWFIVMWSYSWPCLSEFFGEAGGLKMWNEILNFSWYGSLPVFWGVFGASYVVLPVVFPQKLSYIHPSLLQEKIWKPPPPIKFYSRLIPPNLIQTHATITTPMTSNIPINFNT